MLYLIVTSLFKLYFKLFFRLKVYGKENIKKGKCLIAPNHTSFFDPPLIAGAWPGTAAFLARKTLFKSPFSSFILNCLNTYPVGGTTDDLSSLKLIGQLLQANQAVFIFPEGSRSKDGTLSTVKSGIGMIAIRNNAPIIPVYIDGTFEVWPRTQRFPSFCGKLACVFGKPIPCEQFEDLPRKKAYDAMAKKTAEAITSLKLWYESGALGSPP